VKVDVDDEDEGAIAFDENNPLSRTISTPSARSHRSNPP